MFERMEAIKNWKKMNDVLKGAEKLAELTNNNLMLTGVKEMQYKNKIILPILITNKKKAREFNLDGIKNGLF